MRRITRENIETTFRIRIFCFRLHSEQVEHEYNIKLTFLKQLILTNVLIQTCKIGFITIYGSFAKTVSLYCQGKVALLETLIEKSVSNPFLVVSYTYIWMSFLLPNISELRNVEVTPTKGASLLKNSTNYVL